MADKVIGIDISKDALKIASKGISKEEDFDIEASFDLTKPSIEFKDVHFAYESSEEVLKGVSFKIDKNEKIALVGHSGAGKSTLINLITKFYNPSQGVILIGGKEYSELSHNDVRANISLVFQENELFSTTIRENVSYGKEYDEKDYQY